MENANKTQEKLSPAVLGETKTEKKRNIIKTVVQFVVFVGLGVFFVWLSLRSLSKDDFNSIWNAMATINNPMCWFVLGCSALMAILADVCRAVRARLLLESMGYKPRNSMVFYSVMVCYLANLAIPRLGEILRCSFLQRFERVPFQKTLGTVFTERAVDMICWIVLLFFAIGMNQGALSNVIIDHGTTPPTTIKMWMEQKGLSLIGNYFIYVLLGLILTIWLILRLTRKWWIKNRFFAKIHQFFAGIWQGIISIKDLPHPWRYVIWTVLLWIFYFLGTYFVFVAIPYLRPLPPQAAFCVLVFGTIAFMITQGGLGSYPLIAAGIVYMYGINYTQGLAAGWIGWILQTVIVLVLGFASLILAAFYQRRNKPTEENVVNP